MCFGYIFCSHLFASFPLFVLHVPLLPLFLSHSSIFISIIILFIFVYTQFMHTKYVLWYCSIAKRITQNTVNVLYIFMLDWKTLNGNCTEIYKPLISMVVSFWSGLFNNKKTLHTCGACMSIDMLYTLVWFSKKEILLKLAFLAIFWWWTQVVLNL